LKFYDCETAPSPRRVRIFAAEKGLQLETVQIDLANGEQFSAAFREINPDCVVPVLELDDGSRITEVLAICQYLEELQPEPALIGRTPEERAMTMSWAIKVEQHGLMSIRDAFRNTAKGLRGHALTGPVNYEQIPELAARGQKGVVAFLERLEQQLDGREFVAGDSYSIADITAMVFVDFAGWIKIGLPDDAVHLRRWHDAVSSRPSAAA
jgi:glutathione S-transferase